MSSGSPLSPFLRRKLQTKAPIASADGPSLPTSPGAPQLPRVCQPSRQGCSSLRGHQQDEAWPCRGPPFPAVTQLSHSKVTQGRELTCVKASERLVNVAQGTGACLGEQQCRPLVLSTRTLSLEDEEGQEMHQPA